MVHPTYIIILMFLVRIDYIQLTDDSMEVGSATVIYQGTVWRPNNAMRNMMASEFEVCNSGQIVWGSSH